MKLILARHGETIWNREKKIQGITDIGLSDAGVEQAERLALSLQKEKIDAIVTSPLRRAFDTARAIERYHNVPVTVEEDLHEINAGELEGLTMSDIAQKYPDFLSRWMIDRTSVVMPKGESLEDVQRRVWPVIKRVSSISQDAVVVSHSFVIITILCKIQGLPLSESSRLRISAASKTCLSIDNGTGSVLYYNDTGHLHEG